MSSPRFTEWLAITANLAVLAGIIVIVLELQQTQEAMLANSSTLRAQMMSENNSILIDNYFLESQAKLAAGETLTEEEMRGAREFLLRLLRHMENMHYQNQLGLVDAEAWESATRAMRNSRNTPIFDLVLPDWPNSFLASVHRASFITYLESLKN